MAEEIDIDPKMMQVRLTAFLSADILVSKTIYLAIVYCCLKYLKILIKKVLSQIEINAKNVSQFERAIVEVNENQIIKVHSL